MGVTVFQVLMAYMVRDCGWATIAVLGYLVSATCNQNLFCAQHELSHFLALKTPLHNKVRSRYFPLLLQAANCSHPALPGGVQAAAAALVRAGVSMQCCLGRCRPDFDFD